MKSQAHPRRSERDILRRTLSQNFLRDERIVRQLIGSAGLSPDDIVVEVGAGSGMLTRRLADACKKVIAYEYDANLERRLREGLAEHPNVEIVCRDILKSAPPDVEFKVVSNIPFGRTAEIVRWIIGAQNMRQATLITQLEYARKRTGWYGRWSHLTISTWPEFEWRLVARVSRNSFRPVPKVDAAIISIIRRQESLISRKAAAKYRQMVDVGFQGVGGSLFQSLRPHYPKDQLGKAFRKAKIFPSEIVAYVSPDQWIALFQALDE